MEEKPNDIAYYYIWVSNKCLKERTQWCEENLLDLFWEVTKQEHSNPDGSGASRFIFEPDAAIAFKLRWE